MAHSSFNQMFRLSKFLAPSHGLRGDIDSDHEDLFTQDIQCVYTPARRERVVVMTSLTIAKNKENKTAHPHPQPTRKERREGVREFLPCLCF